MNNRSVCLFLLLSAGLIGSAVAQSAFDVTNSKPIEINGFEYGYSIQNQCTKDFINLGTFKRYELVVYVTNKSGSPKVFNPRQTSFGTRDQDLLAHFDCLNATGAKLTSKTIAVRARSASAPEEASAKTSPGNMIAAPASSRAGHLFENGETITNNIIVIIPDGEDPHMRVRLRMTEKPPVR